MFNKNIFTNLDYKKNLLDTLKIRNLTTKNNLKESETTIKNKYESHELKKISLNSLKSNINNPNSMSVKSNNITEINLLRYRPKRLIKLKEQGKIQMPLSKIGGLSIDLEKTFSSDDKRYILKKNKNSNQKLLNNISDTEKFMNSNNNTEFKSTYILKFAKNSEEFNKYISFRELIDDNNNKRIFEETFSNLSKLIENQNKLLFNNIDSYSNNNNNNNNISIINNFEISPVKNTYLNMNMKNQMRNKSNNDITNFFTNTYNNISSMNNSINSGINSTNFSSPNQNNHIKKLIIYWCDFITYLNKVLAEIFNEFNLCKKENEKMKKKSYRDELKLNNKINELDNLKKYLNRFDINKKIYSQIQKEKEIQELKKEFKKKENEYILLIYKLEDEIRDLTIVLDKNKFYFDEYKKIKKEIDKNKRQRELLKNRFHKELEDTNVKILLEKDYQDELLLQIEKLNNEINEMKIEKEISKTVSIELQAKIKKLEMTIDEKRENILMLNEELEWYIRKLNEEKFNYNNFKTEFHILEKKYLNLEEEMNKEQGRKNDIDNKEELSPKHIKKEDNYCSPSPTDFTQGNNS